MTSGKIHDRHIRKLTWLTPALSIPLAIYLDTLIVALLFPVAFWWTGLWLSPDVDTRSNPYYRWRWMRWIWVPLQVMTTHRGITHYPLIGSLVRLAWIGLPVGAIAYCLYPQAIEWVQWEWAIAIYAACELSTWVHLFGDAFLRQDGTWKKKR